MDNAARATDEEKNLLRRSIVRKATIEETDWWINQNLKFLSEKARTVFHDMSDEDKFRVMSEGPLSECRDVVEILYGRVKRFMEMEAKLRSMANSGTKAVEKPKEKQVSQVAQQIAHQMAMPILEEVPESERRLGTVGTVNAVKESKEKVLIGTKQGVGGVIEALQKKYNMQKGQRAKVIAETKELWKMDGDLNVPKVHMNKGWKWVLQGGDEAAKKKAEDQARKKAEKEEHEKLRKQDKHKKEERAQDETDKKTKSVKEKKVKKSRERKRSSESRSSSSPKRKTKSKSKSKQKRKTSSEKDSGSDSVQKQKKRKAKRSSSSDSDWKRLYRK